MAPHATYVFKHALVQDAAWDTPPRGATSHARIPEADWLAFEGLLGGLVAGDLRQPTDAVTLEHRCSDDRVKFGMVACRA